MEGSKNAMYAQVGKSRGWTQGAPDGNAPAKVPEKRVQDMPAEPVMPIIPMMPEIAEIPMIPMAPMVSEKLEIPITPMAATIPETLERPMTPVVPMIAEEIATSMMPPIPAPPVVIAPVAKVPAKECQALAMAYVEMQKWQKLYETEQGFSRGTIFSELDLPFVGEGACRYE